MELSNPNLEQFRGYLLFLVQFHWDVKGKVQCDPEDLVQQTFLEAHQKRDHFKGTTETELVAWLRCILANNMADESRRLGRAKRNVNLEQPLANDMEFSAARLRIAWSPTNPRPANRRLKMNKWRA